ncbi:MAG: DNA mismatch repair endonuclease MutH [Legionellales bacterium RIFCSPHIGHO2_12_FULL_42_9]|nr:MAG: DNA mismatch repair endonuclease MutH [Legionellales bacterium RIFCSPHIGHO2_12_FULL_42_9]
MSSQFSKIHPRSEAELLRQCRTIEGLSFLQLADLIGVSIPDEPNKRKGWAGLAVEIALGTDAGNQSAPDFTNLGIELKTVPLNKERTPIESTFITSIPLLTIHQQSWKSSQCFAKLKRVLWVPVEGESDIPFIDRRVGRPIVWSPTVEQELILSKDWEELTELVTTGRLDEIHAGIGQCLQIRPKAATGKSVCYGFDNDGNKILTLPRGFYLRRLFTKIILNFNR